MSIQLRWGFSYYVLGGFLGRWAPEPGKPGYVAGNSYSTYLYSSLKRFVCFCIGTNPCSREHVSHLPFCNFSFWKSVFSLEKGKGKQDHLSDKVAITSHQCLRAFASDPFPASHPYQTVGSKRPPSPHAVLLFLVVCISSVCLAFFLITSIPSANGPAVISCTCLKALSPSHPSRAGGKGKKWLHLKHQLSAFYRWRQKRVSYLLLQCLVNGLWAGF